MLNFSEYKPFYICFLNSGGSRILEGDAIIGKKHILRCIRSSMNLFSFDFAGKNREDIFSKGGAIASSHPL